MSRVVNAVVVALAAIVLVAGVVWYVAVVGQEEKVSADVKWRVESTDEQRTVVVADVLFQNRLEADLELVGVEVAYEVAGVAVASNHSEDPGTLAARGSLSVPMRLLVPPDVAIDVVRQHVISDETSAAVLEGRGVFHVGEETVEVPIRERWGIESAIADSLSREENCPGPAFEPCLAKMEASWEEEGEARFLAARLHVRNAGAEELRVDEATVRLRFGDVVVADSQAPGAVVAAGRSAPLDVRLFLEREALLGWWSGHVGRCEESAVSLEVEFAYEAGPGNGTTPSNTTSPPPSPTNTTAPSPSPTNTSRPPSNTTEYRYAAAGPAPSGRVDWRFDAAPFATRVACRT